MCVRSQAEHVDLVDNAAASGIDEYRALAHLREQAPVKQSQRYADRNHVGLPKQLIETLPSLKPKATRDLLRKTL